MKNPSFVDVYRQLNTAQREAVDTIYGPVLVIAGPGTGKTQLLSARVAKILEATDALPQNILCLTFTEGGARNMRERLGRFIGSAAYDVQINTYHAFGSTIINRYPEYFTDLRLERPVDELGKRQILEEIVQNLDYRNPLKQIRHHLGDLIGTISEIKRGLLSPEDLRIIAQTNLDDIQDVQNALAKILQPYTSRMPSKLTTAVSVYTEIVQALTHEPGLNSATSQPIVALTNLAATELQLALTAAQESNSTRPLTRWKNSWLVKNVKGQYTLGGSLESRRVTALADVLEAYHNALQEKGLYDFDDMILRAIDVLERNDDLRYTLQEQYQYILLDEFQDTNAAQLQLVRLLTDNPVNEGRPNILAVGDDDQAIYAFQGAEASNMLDYYRLYRDVKVISLQENYRSRAEILETSRNIASQVNNGLEKQFNSVSKELTAENTNLPPATLARQVFVSSVAEYTAVSKQIAQLVQSGTAPSQIAVLAPKHKYLEPLVPYIQKHTIPVSYEKRENILHSKVIRELLTMARLVLALQESNHAVADSLWPEVLSYDFWGFPIRDIWQISWRASSKHKSWSELLLSNKTFNHAALLILSLASKVETESLEYILDALIGSSDVQTRDKDMISTRSPLRDYYLGSMGESILYETVSQLTVLRSRLREHEKGEGRPLQLSDLIRFVSAYETAEQPMLNTSPYSQKQNAVQLMTVYKAKGLEFDHVFMIACDDSAWGGRASGSANKLTLPPNLSHIRHAGSTDDERLRLIYVALTRARHGLHMTSHEHSYTGKHTEPVKYFEEAVGDDNRRTIAIFPDGFQLVHQDSAEAPSLEALSLHWQQRHHPAEASLADLLSDRLKQYQLSPTHLTHFLDFKYGGPESFLLGTLLRFPSAPTPETVFGNAIHETLQWMQGELNRTNILPPVDSAILHAQKMLSREQLRPQQMEAQHIHAKQTLEAYLRPGHARFQIGNIAEKSFREEGVFLDEVHLGGKIDLLEIDVSSRTITVVDYKTGRLGSDPAKLHRYTLQLYCYKLLVENSRTYRGYRVKEGRLVFVEPNLDGEIMEVPIVFQDQEAERVKQLLRAMWHHVMTLNMPDTASYGDSLKHMMSFENYLIDSLRA